MTKENGDKVSWRSLHEELKDQSKERQAMEERLVDALAQGFKVIRDEVDRYHDENNARMKCAEQDIIALRVSGNWWKGFNATIAAAITGLGLWLGQK